MKRKSFLVPAVLLFVFLLAGCVGTKKIVIGDSLAESEIAVLEFRDSIHLIQFNGEPVKWEGRVGKKSEVTVPAGAHNITMRYYIESRQQMGYSTYVTTTSYDIEEPHEFLPGHTYRVTLKTVPILGIVQGIKVKDVTKE
ncbi:hypothetical protein LJC14_03920 [Treponema sp. OttesenSCG-928-L16]|nr:hypothetical protein [Treponema sp. OttesenSCG-928-L16]